MDHVAINRRINNIQNAQSVKPKQKDEKLSHLRWTKFLIWTKIAKEQDGKAKAQVKCSMQPLKSRRWGQALQISHILLVKDTPPWHKKKNDWHKDYSEAIGTWKSLIVGERSKTVKCGVIYIMNG